MVKKSQQSDTTSNPTAAKLLEVESDLAHQEAVLLAQLESIREKRKSLKTVIDLFGSANSTTAASDEASATAQSNGISAVVEPRTEVVVPPELQIEPATTTTDSSQAAEPVESPQEKKTRSATKTKQPAASKKTASTPEPTTTAPASQPEPTQSTKAKSTSSVSKTKQPAAAKKAAKKTGRWQDYLREEFSNFSLSEAVSLVLQRQPEEVLETAAIIDAIFTGELTKEVRNTARERIANVLSDGVRKNKWYRGEAGSYSMSFQLADEAKEAD